MEFTIKAELADFPLVTASFKVTVEVKCGNEQVSFNTSDSLSLKTNDTFGVNRIVVSNTSDSLELLYVLDRLNAITTLVNHTQLQGMFSTSNSLCPVNKYNTFEDQNLLNAYDSSESRLKLDNSDKVSSAAI